MSYQEYKAPVSLAGYIDSFWTVDGLPESEVHRVVPDGCSDIIINLGRSDCSIPGESIGISGMMTTFQDVNLGPSTKIMGVRFRTGQLRHFTSSPLSQTKNLSVHAADLIPHCNNELLHRIADANTNRERFSLIEKTLCSILASDETTVTPRIQTAITVIEQHDGILNVETLAHNLCISQRQLERQFKEQVGVTIKEFCRITRFSIVSDYLKRNPTMNLSETAHHFGYFDHSHMTNEFRKISGSAPSLHT